MDFNFSFKCVRVARLPTPEYVYNIIVSQIEFPKIASCLLILQRVRAQLQILHTTCSKRQMATTSTAVTRWQLDNVTRMGTASRPSPSVDQDAQV